MRNRERENILVIGNNYSISSTEIGISLIFIMLSHKILAHTSSIILQYNYNCDVIYIHNLYISYFFLLQLIFPSTTHTISSYFIHPSRIPLGGTNNLRI